MDKYKSMTADKILAIKKEHYGDLFTSDELVKDPTRQDVLRMSDVYFRGNFSGWTK